MQMTEDMCCSYTFQRASDLPDNMAMRRCSRCKATYYSSVSAQRAHWPIHKTTCSLGDSAAVEQLGLKSCTTLMKQKLRNPTVLCGNTVLIMRKIRALLESGDDDTGDRIDAIVSWNFTTWPESFVRDRVPSHSTQLCGGHRA